MIPSPNLDDRTYKQIVDEAIGLIPHYCPEWTNFNPTDPGITLIELFAWMSEMMIYRLNKVPDKTYLTLLDLVGLSLSPAQASRVLLTFNPVDGYKGSVPVKKSTKVSTVRSVTGDLLTFETERDLNVSSIKLSSIVETKSGKISDFTKYISEGNGVVKELPLFSGNSEIERYLYLTDPSFMHLNYENSVHINFNKNGVISSREDEIINFLSFECWNGSKWVHLDSSRIIPGQKQKDNQIYITGPVSIEECEINGETGYFIRAYLDDVPGKTSCFDLNHIESRLLFGGDGLLPENCFTNNSNMVFNTVDLSKDFLPYQGVPKYNDSFYISSSEVFSKKGSEIIINMDISKGMNNEEAEPNDHLRLKWEYWNGRTWLTIGESSPKGVLSPIGESHFLDTTCCFVKSGRVSFICPEDICEFDLNGLSNYWIRVRVVAGDFGKGGQHVRDEDGKWTWVFENPVKPPLLSSLSLKYQIKPEPPKGITVYENFEYRAVINELKKNFLHLLDGKKDKRESVSVFNLKSDREPITYFGFDRAFPKGENSIYFKVNEEKRSNRPQEYIKEYSGDRRGISLRWEYFNGEKWLNLGVNDYTDSFHKSGFIEFTTPIKWKNSTIFAKDQFWIRVVFESGSFEKEAVIENILLNSVYAGNYQLIEDELLGTSNGSPNQKYRPLKGNLLPKQVLVVKEESLPPENEREIIIREEGIEAIEENEDGSVWIKYHQVDNFYASKPNSRHYVVDYTTSEIILGDGRNGMVPPRVKNNLKLKEYLTGGGKKGNVGKNTITVLRENIPYLKSVINCYQAEGGSDHESIDDLKNRGSRIFKNLNRAVTAEDFEYLALEASTSVGRAKCLSGIRADGSIVVVVIPKMDNREISLTDKLYPSKELLRRTYNYLDKRKILGTKLRVEPPVYKDVTMEIKFILNRGVMDKQSVKKMVMNQVYRYLHPILGGPKGEGWAFGKNISKSDIINVVLRNRDIYIVESVIFYRASDSMELEEIKLKNDELVYINSIDILDRDYQ